MESILDWIKKILYFSVFLTVFMQLLPGESYKKYVRFFAGILLIILAVNPVLTFLSKEDFADRMLESIVDSRETVDMELDEDELAQAQQKYYRRQADKAVENAVKEQAQQMELSVENCDVTWSEDGEKIASITVMLDGATESEDGTENTDGKDSPAERENPEAEGTQSESEAVKRIDVDRTVIEQIQVQTGHGNTQEEMKHTLSDRAERLKKELIQTFELSDDQVYIVEG